MGIFAQDQWPIFTRQADPFFNRPFRHHREWLILIHPRIHRADNVGRGSIGSTTFILHRSTWIARLDPAVQAVMRRTMARFIAQRPDDDRRMVKITLHHAGDTLGKGANPERIVRQTVHRRHAMRFDIGLIHHIQTEAVTELIPVRMIRIMRGTHRIEVIALHQQHVLQHIFRTHRLPAFRMKFMPVGTTDQNRLAIDQQQAVFDFHTAETDITGLCLHQHAIICFQRHHQPVQIRYFCRP